MIENAEVVEGISEVEVETEVSEGVDMVEHIDSMDAIDDVDTSETMPEEVAEDISERLEEDVSGEEVGSIPPEGFGDKDREKLTEIARLTMGELDEFHKQLESQNESLSNSITVLKEELEGEVSGIRSDLGQLKSEQHEVLKRNVSVKSDLKTLTRRLRRVLKEAEALEEESLDATKIPPDVLQLTYSTTLNDMLGHIVSEFGLNAAVILVSESMELVRSSSAGMDFFRFVDNKFIVDKLANAIEAKLVSSKQIHATYIELFQKLSLHVPNYEARDFRSFVETGSREYSVDMISSHTKELERIDDTIKAIDEVVGGVSTKVDELTTSHDGSLTKIEEVSDSVDTLSEKITNITKQLNNHTKNIGKISNALKKYTSSLDSKIGDVATSFTEYQSIMAGELAGKSGVEQMDQIASELSDIRKHVDEELITKADHEEIKEVVVDMRIFMDEFLHLQGEVKYLTSASRLPAQERMVIDVLKAAGRSTLKKIEKTVESAGIDESRLFHLIDELEKGGYIVSERRGRYTYYALSEGLISKNSTE